MQVTNGDIWAAQGAIEEVCREPWPVKTAYWLAKLKRALAQHYPVVEEVRRKLVVQYGTLNETGQTAVTRESETWPQFETDFNALMDESCAFELEPVVLASMNGLQIAPNTLLALGPFVTMEEP